MTRIYRNPFAFNGDKVDIAESSQPDGRISIEDGWTTDYELPEGEPNYKPVERDEMNGIFNEVTQAVGEIQLNGFPVWQSLPGGWPSLAIVRHGNDVWRSTKDSNGSTPGVNEDWTNISFMSPGEGGGQVRTNEQNDEEYFSLSFSGQRITSSKTWERPSNSTNSSYVRYSGEGIDGLYMDFTLSEYSQLAGWVDIPVTDTHILRLRRGGSAGGKNISGFAIGSTDGPPTLFAHATEGVVLGIPLGGFKGQGSLNALQIYENGHRAWTQGSLSFSLSGTVLTITDNS